ncbi:predicted protein [Phaeodactylum tricornutum CCAP 1055/1]|uniref:Uncharacterized protein n=1 Tax=Phaeodactylum tricornutum (strain CCAP 1055/1) TaxID=556484 RepID=B7FYL5_PHATC|nr:predicted protein [Phaeodactylum tricornutum CCAP 1055/1]EEC48937.1 predicted protein [Phaeodactylum tricornutum CCAP 1055/1]|eukprot:XP_002179951.1 predicted protein [Phaeodactylum tricornutum CCAP 1055/1]
MKETDEITAALDELGISASDLGGPDKDSPPTKLHPIIAFGIGAFCVANLGLLMSLPPVLRGKGAPYLPTFQKNLDAMFRQLRQQPHFQKQIRDGTKLTFVDLGSGDGRVVFRAAAENLFVKSTGYELNPLLHLLASGRRWVGGPRQWELTTFYCSDLWNVDLRRANVVTVYGLGPIMKDLGTKLENELSPGSFILSNVFTFPGWKPQSSQGGTYIYRTPNCWQSENRL